MTEHLLDKSLATTDSVHDISLENCNSIDRGRIQLFKGKLNVKYGPNGTGKSTIARVLDSRTKGEKELEQYTPFKHKDDAKGARPSVLGADDIKSALVFDEDYVSAFVFQPTEVLKDSFEVFINTEEYRQGLADIAKLFESLKDTFSQDPHLEEAIAGFTRLRDVFGVTKAGAISKTSSGFKALSMVGKLHKIPNELQGFQGFLEGADPGGWISWQSKGKAFLDHSDNCPFCSVPNLNRAVAERVSTEYESAAVKNLNAIRSVVDQLGDYVEPSNLAQLQEITTVIDGLTPEQLTFLSTIQAHITTLLAKLTEVRDVSFFAFQEDRNIKEKLAKLKIDLPLLSTLASPKTKEVTDAINTKLDEVAEKIAEVAVTVDRQKGRVKKLVESNQESINDFLRSAGYKYSVRIIPDGDTFKMILEHQDSAGHLGKAGQHLSYGEKNAFALVLFMHQVKQIKPDLVILDDPVSSFDKTKKFAILHKLFHNDDGIRQFTTLFLTHDIEPVIDMLVSGPLRKGMGDQAVAHFLRSFDGVLEENRILRDDVKTFAQICDRNISEASDIAIKCIYLRRRLEVSGDYGLGYQLLSSLLHLREVPTRQELDGRQIDLTPDQIHESTELVRSCLNLPEFDYSSTVADLRAEGDLIARFDAASAGYEKVQLFRIFSELPSVQVKASSPFQKFVNESFHIENEYLMQLDPRKFDAVPEHIVKECEALIDSHRPIIVD
ncbi:AAA family ATPase [Klugiella xanthotipulae]|uniref:AAA domain-containing protein n=1 Tax=Klugiella xanthotipulae TaxID=244735 RepID=A0A543I3T5_9MICO|nr:AAA family ATPase [Klugiella xanthotipulae]TQM65235.1 AAA domain-containing protein [Klugiella xanthotipulae]